MNEFNGLLIGEHQHPKKWTLQRGLKFTTTELEADEIMILASFGVDISPSGKISVRSGFQTELESMPSAVWTVLKPRDICRAAIIHESLYRSLRAYCDSERYDKETWKKARSISDKVFLSALEAAEPPLATWKKKTIYKMVRTAGASLAKPSKKSGK